MPMNSDDGFLAGLVDYAGLFPPAKLQLADAVSNYASYRHGPRSTMLGRFVVPVGKLGDLANAVRQLGSEEPPWEVSVLVGEDVADGLSRIAEALAEHLDAAPLRVCSIEAIATGRLKANLTLPPTVEAFFEIDHRTDPTEWIETAAAAGVGAKIRTGGTEASAFPASREIARFLLACARERLPFKATAGLHHPFPDTYPLTYEANSPRGQMHGFMNFFCAAALVWQGHEDATEISALLDCQEIPVWDDERRELRWAGHRLGLDDLATARREFARSYGSCSFLEPIQGLEHHRLL